MPVKAAVFDLDGTLVDNMPAHADAWVTLSQRLGLDVHRDRFLREFAGQKNEEIIPTLLPHATADDVARIAGDKEALYRELYRPRLQPLAGLLALLDELDARGVRLAVASAAPKENRALVLDGLDLRRRFARVIGAEDAKRGKPHPDIFLAAAAALDVAPADCLAFEDAVLGVQAARAAGMECVGVTTAQPAEALRAAGARWIIADFTQLPRDALDR